MANNHTKQYVTCDGHSRHMLAGYFHGTAATTVLSKVVGVGFSVTRSNTGVYTICLSNTYPGLVGLAMSGPMSNTIIGTPIMVQSSTVSATNTITINTVSNTTTGAVAVELGTGVGLSFVGVFANSSLTT